MKRDLLTNPREGEGVPWAQCAGWGAAILIAIAACGGATRDGGASDGSSVTDSGSQSDGGDSADTGTSSKQRIKCSNVSEGAACDEGDTCDSDCSNPCQFCNLYTCSNGQWTAEEVFPLPPTDPMCTDAGPDAEAGLH